MTSYHGVDVWASRAQLMQVLGQPEDVDDGCNYNFEGTLNGIPFSLYDWRYKRGIGKDEEICWHIGAEDKSQSIDVKDHVKKLLSTARTTL